MSWQMRPLSKMSLGEMRDSYIEIETDKFGYATEEPFKEARRMTKKSLTKYLQYEGFK